MKDNYNRSVKLRCVCCGDDSSFTHNEDSTYIKCEKCGREYLGGYDELVELNKELIDEAVEEAKNEVVQDIHDELNKIFKKWK